MHINLRKYRIAIGIYILWVFLHLFLLLTSAGYERTKRFWPFGSAYYYSVDECYDMSEFIIYSIAPIVFYVVYKLFKIDDSALTTDSNTYIQGETAFKQERVVLTPDQKGASIFNTPAPNKAEKIKHPEESQPLASPVQFKGKNTFASTLLLIIFLIAVGLFIVYSISITW